MDKYLMSSPTQLSQLMVTSDTLSRQAPEEDISTQNQNTGHYSYLGSQGYEASDYAPILPEFPEFGYEQTPADADRMTATPSYARGHSKNFSVDGYMQMPYAANAGPSPGAPPASRPPFLHSRNVSLDDQHYRMSASRHAPSASLASNQADPPSGVFSHSASHSTPSSSASPPPGARLSASHSSNNLYTTPLRGSAGPSPRVKIGKSSTQRHRSRSRTSLEPGSAQLLASLASMKSSLAGQGQGQGLWGQGGHQSQNHLLASSSNPFDATLLSPGSLAPLDDYDATPLATPARGDASYAPMYFTPVNASNSFGGSLQEPVNGYQQQQQHTQIPQNESLGMPAFVRSAKLEAISGEDDEDDACMQLRRVRSFASNTDPRSMLTRAASLRSVRPVAAPYVPSAAAIDLLSPQMNSQARDSTLRSYPASIDLASITRAGATQPPSPSAAQNAGLLPPLPSARSTSSIPTLAHKRFNESSSFTNLATKTTVASPTARAGGAPYPNTSQIQETSTTEEIAKFAESIMNSDMKRPIIVQEDSDDIQDPKKKHKCPLCLARFQRPEHVKRHLKSHSSEKPFQCDMPDCGRRFNRKDNLKAHLKKIHGHIF